MTRFTLLLFIVSALWTDGKPESAAFPGDVEFFRLDYTAAERRYEAVLKDQPSDAGALWRLARLYVIRGEATEGEPKLSLYQKGETYARRAVGLNPACAEAHTWLAGALGNIAMMEGARRRVQLSWEIKSQLDSALALNPEDHLAYGILGSYHRALGNVSWFERQVAAVFFGGLPEGSHEEGVFAFHRAIALAPQVMRHHLELGKLYRDMGRDADARQCFEEVVRLRVLVLSDSILQRDARLYLKELSSG